jgi:hypothetical protein
MAFYIQKPSLIDNNITVYYAGNNRWTDDSSQKELFESESSARDIMENVDGKNGGWSNSQIVSE